MSEASRVASKTTEKEKRIQAQTRGRSWAPTAPGVNLEAGESELAFSEVKSGLESIELHPTGIAYFWRGPRTKLQHVVHIASPEFGLARESMALRVANQRAHVHVSPS